jgi:hypothetical protein
MRAARGPSVVGTHPAHLKKHTAVLTVAPEA